MKDDVWDLIEVNILLKWLTLYGKSVKYTVGEYTIIVINCTFLLNLQLIFYMTYIKGQCNKVNNLRKQTLVYITI